jgi:hypothetical protein
LSAQLDVAFNKAFHNILNLALWIRAAIRHMDQDPAILPKQRFAKPGGVN